MKRNLLIAVMLTFCIVVSSAIGFMAAVPGLNVNGIKVAFNDDLGYPYIDSNLRTMVPLKAAVEAAGATIGWDSKTKTAIIVTDKVRVEVPIGTNILYINGVKVVNDTKSVTIGGRTYLPIKTVLEAVGFNINWDNATRTVLAHVNDVFKVSNSESYSGVNLTKSIYGVSTLGYTKTSNSIIYKGKTYKIIQVDGGDLSGNRLSNVAVDIGFGNREYWGLTNEYGQLVFVLADLITLQDDSIEPVTSNGRYYPDEAKVPGTERSDLDEGHVIADSLGGVSNAYNITPQDSVINQAGNQAYMEKWIRDAGGCADFLAVITYPNTSTQIPSHYSYTYTLKGSVANDEFDNVNPENTQSGVTETGTGATNEGIVEITKLDKQAEYIIIKNISDKSIDLTGWKIRSVRGDQWFTFSKFILDAGASAKIGDSAKNSDVNFHWLDGNGTWNNSDSDPAELYNASGILMDELKN